MPRVAVVTGAAGGIGASTVDAFSSAGWRVVAVDREFPSGKLEGAYRHHSVDISDVRAVETLFAQIARECSGVDALVNNAAVQVCKPVVETSVEEWDLMMNTNLRSVFIATRAALPLLRARGGSIVNVSSVHAVATSADISVYAASKGGLLAFTRALAVELGADSIRANAVLPGATDTGMLRSGLSRGHVSAGTADAALAQLASRHVLQRIARPDEIAQAILFLADHERSSFITGQALVVDGGATARLSTE